MAKRRPKDIGTDAERTAQRWLTQVGWPDCERIALHGAQDQGDLIVCRSPRIIAEVKGGKTAEKAGPGMLADWWEQTETEAVNAGADLAVLIVRRFNRHVEAWDAWMPAHDWALLTTGESVLPLKPPVLLRGSLASWSRLARRWAS